MRYEADYEIDSGSYNEIIHLLYLTDIRTEMSSPNGNPYDVNVDEERTYGDHWIFFDNGAHADFCLSSYDRTGRYTGYMDFCVPGDDLQPFVLHQFVVRDFPMTMTFWVDDDEYVINLIVY